MIRLYLYRMKLVATDNERQGLLLEKGVSKPDILKKLILFRPGAVVRKEVEWTMADSTSILGDSIFFHFGRITKKQKDKFDRENRSIYGIMDDDVDRVSCFYDASLQILAVEKRSEPPNPSTIAKYISKVVSSCKENKEFLDTLNVNEKSLLLSTRPQIDAIPDPMTFIEYIKKAYRISSFEVCFSPANPYDYDELIQEPMQRLMSATNGESSKAKISTAGSLKKDAIIDLSHAAAAHGDDAKAKIFGEDSEIGEVVRLKNKNNNAHVEFFDEELEKKESIFKLIMAKFLAIRG